MPNETPEATRHLIRLALRAPLTSTPELGPPPHGIFARPPEIEWLSALAN
jgi:hypothetical protein